MLDSVSRFPLARMLPAVLGLWLLAAGHAHAGSFDVAPISLTLSDTAKSGIITVKNKSTEELRFHISAMAWGQKTDGEMVLSPTKDIVFFPAMMTLGPGKSRNLRVGVTQAAGNVEKTYRVFVQELPPAIKGPDQEGTVRMLTKMGIPIFHQSGAPRGVASITNPTISQRKVRFDVQNKGNAHYRAQTITLIAKAGGKVVHKEEVDGWYILAGGTRTYGIELPEAACNGLTSIEIEMKSDLGTTKASLANASCGG